MSERFLKMADVMAITAMSRSTIKAWVKAGKFPAPTKLGRRLIRWPESVVSEWVKGKGE